MGWAAAIPIIANVAGGVMGNAAAGGADRASQSAQQRALQELLALNAPSIASQELNLDQYTSAGDLSPVLAGLSEQGDTNLAGIQQDPRLMQAQMDVLNRLESINQSGGMDDIMKAQLFDSRNNAAAEANSQNQAIREEMARRGQSGGGLEMLNRMMANDSALNRMAATDMQTNAMAQQRALEALNAQANLAATMDNAQYGRQSDAAKAQDLINQFNTSNRNQNNVTNANTQNQTNQTNLQNKQNLLNSNTDVRNQQQQYNKELIQQKFQNDKDVASLRSGAYNSEADRKAKEAQATRNQWANIGGGIGQMGAGLASKK